jgi:LacI family transcriptional regulator
MRRLTKMARTRPTIRDVAVAAGVSVGTASRVINGYTSVAADIRLRVQSAIEELGYEPSVVAQSMRSGATRTIGVIVRDITVSIFADFVRSIEETLDTAGYSLIIACSEDQKDREAAIMRMFDRRKVDGLIMTTASENDSELVKTRAALGIPIVFTDREVKGGYDSAFILHRAGTRQATEYLIGIGHRRIGLITGSQRLYPGRERVAGYREAFAAHGLSPELGYVRADSFHSDFCFSAAMDLLQGPRRATAIIAGGFGVLSHVLRAARQLRLAVPQDLSLVSGADSELAQLSSPSITSITSDMSSVGRNVAKLLLDRISGAIKGEARRLTFPAELSIRESCRRIENKRPRSPVKSSVAHAHSS